MKLTAAIITRMLAYLVRENVIVVIRIAGRARAMAQEIRHPSLKMKKHNSN
jgi:hypothetical protein